MGIKAGISNQFFLFLTKSYITLFFNMFYDFF